MTGLTHMVRGALAGVALLLALPAAAQDLRLLMIEQVGCAVCMAFNRDVAPGYALSPAGALAPLVHANLRGPMPDGVVLATRPFVTPTFILIGADGHEISRMLGFPGEDFFWPFIDEMIAAAQPAG